MNVYSMQKKPGSKIYSSSESSEFPSQSIKVIYESIVGAPASIVDAPEIIVGAFRIKKAGENFSSGISTNSNIEI